MIIKLPVTYLQTGRYSSFQLFKGSLCIVTGSLSISVYILVILIPSRIFKVRKENF